jgi:hypothetical protein
MIRLFLLFWFVTGCTSSVKTIFEEKKTQKIIDKIEVSKKIVRQFKTTARKPTVKSEIKTKKRPKKEAPLKKRVVKSTRPSPKKLKKQMLPLEIRDKFSELDRGSREIWGDFNSYLKNEEDLILKVYYLGLTVGHLKMSIKPMVKVGDRLAYHFNARIKSARYYSYFYSLDNAMDSFFDHQSKRPLKFFLIQRESKKKVDDLQLFDLDKQKTFVWYKRVKEGKNKKYEKEKFIPKYFLDTLSAFYFTRGLPLDEGKQYRIPIVSRGKIYFFHMEVGELESLKLNDRVYKAHRIKAYSVDIKKQKKGGIVFWYSNNPQKNLLKFTAQLKIGQVKGELIKYEKGRPLQF